ncbi:hypothetical protein AB0B66_11940 [Catellatospora sp. NPDC049111]|uniref:hypothetical protein n=1 Tax=Catellatospora sp. NPDC049111 TaxID=3155271 RepID=UPI0033E5219E
MTVRIYDIMACDVYWDFEDSVGLPKEQHKFLVSFYPSETPVPDQIESIVARGPGGYEVAFTNRMFTNANRDGWIYDPSLDYHWYMLNVPAGFLAEGTYTIEVTTKDGEVLTRSREQRSAPSRAIVDSYLAHRDRMAYTLTSWSTLAEFGGPDAYYVYRLAQAASLREFDTQQLLWWDNIYIRRARGVEPLAGLNKGSVDLPIELTPGETYGLFVEITDGNAQGEANICVFQPHRFLVA